MGGGGGGRKENVDTWEGGRSTVSALGSPYYSDTQKERGERKRERERKERDIFLKNLVIYKYIPLSLITITIFFPVTVVIISLCFRNSGLVIHAYKAYLNLNL